MLCVYCNSVCTTAMNTEEIPYSYHAIVVVQVPTHTCGQCNISFTDYIADEIRHDAVCRYRKTMTPREILSLRGTLSRKEFAEQTCIDEDKIRLFEESLSWIDKESNDKLEAFKNGKDHRNSQTSQEKAGKD